MSAAIDRVMMLPCALLTSLAMPTTTTQHLPDGNEATFPCFSMTTKKVLPEGDDGSHDGDDDVDGDDVDSDDDDSDDDDNATMTTTMTTTQCLGESFTYCS